MTTMPIRSVKKMIKNGDVAGVSFAEKRQMAKEKHKILFNYYFLQRLYWRTKFGSPGYVEIRDRYWAASASWTNYFNN